MLLLCSVIKAVDQYKDILRLSVATAGNDTRLGSAEAPPTVISMYLGEQTTYILEALVETGIGEGHGVRVDAGYGGDCGDTYDHGAVFELGVKMLPKFPKDTTDRNRTSPIAFTGNKFEFRMVGSSLSVSMPNVVLNTIVAESLSEISDLLEKAKDIQKALNELIKSTYMRHRRIIFNGNNYSAEWESEAAKRGLLNLKSTVDAAPCLIDKRSAELFKKHGVFSENEIAARYDIILGNYAKTVNIEALTMIEMTRREIIPAVISFTSSVCEAYNRKAGCPLELYTGLEEDLLRNLSELEADVLRYVTDLEGQIKNKPAFDGKHAEAEYFKSGVIPVMEMLREAADRLECIVGEGFWPFPVYGELLYKI
jgi:glutamine synthetase